MMLIANLSLFFDLQFDPLYQFKSKGLTEGQFISYKEQNKNIYEANNTILFA